MRSALPTKADVALMKSMPRAPDAADAPHVARWYKNIVSYSSLEVYVCGRGGGSSGETCAQRWWVVTCWEGHESCIFFMWWFFASGAYLNSPSASISLDGVVLYATLSVMVRFGDPPNSAAFSGEAPKEKTDDDFGDDLFGDTDSDEEEALKAQEERAQAALAAKEVRDAKKAEAGKKAVAKSSVVLEVKPWESDTDMAAMEAAVRAIDTPGLTWGASKLQEIGYGIKKLVIMCTIIDELVPSTDDITEKIEAFEDFVQSCDIAAFNKL